MFLSLVFSLENGLATYKVNVLDTHCDRIVYILWDKDLEEYIRIHWKKNLRIALPFNVTHLQGKNMVVLCTGLRKARIKFKKNNKITQH